MQHQSSFFKLAASSFLAEHKIYNRILATESFKHYRSDAEFIRRCRLRVALKARKGSSKEMSSCEATEDVALADCKLVEQVEQVKRSFMLK